MTRLFVCAALLVFASLPARGQTVYGAQEGPFENLRLLYPFGALERIDGEIARRGGIRWTIKAGVVFDNAILVREVVEMVAEAKSGWTDPVPLLFEPRFTTGGEVDR